MRTHSHPGIAQSTAALLIDLVTDVQARADGDESVWDTLEDWRRGHITVRNAIDALGPDHPVNAALYIAADLCTLMRYSEDAAAGATARAIEIALNRAIASLLP